MKHIMNHLKGTAEHLTYVIVN